MIRPWRHRVALLTLLLVLVACDANTGEPTTDTTEAIQMDTATGRFDVTMSPLDSDAAESSTLNLMTLSKEFEGDLEGPSSGHALLVQTEVEGSAGYVAVERFTGTLNGRTGSFVMQHYGLLAADGEGQEHVVAIVPDTGTGELAGIRGTMAIEVGDDHLYELRYSLGGG